MIRAHANPNGTVLGWAVQAVPKKHVVIFAEGRVCETEGCGTRLSRYNRLPFCSIHAPAIMVPYRTRRRRRPLTV